MIQGKGKKCKVWSRALMNPYTSMEATEDE